MSGAATPIRRLGRNTLIYGFGVVLSRAASFIMLPVYTRYLTPADYGILQLLQMTLDVAAILLSAGLTAGVFRFYFKAATHEERSAVIVTSLALVVGINAIGTISLLLGAPWIARYLLDTAQHAALVRITAFTFLLEIFTYLPMTLMQMRHRAGLYTVTSTAKLLMMLSLNIAFVVGFGWGVRGMLLSSLLSAAVVGGAATVWMFRQTGFRFSRSVARDLIRFGMPYKLTQMGTFALTFSDRFFLKVLHSLSAVGLYGLAYQFGFLLYSLAAAPFFRAWTPQRFQHAEDDRSIRDRFHNEGFLYLSLALVTVAVGIALFVRPVLSVMSDEAFHGAAYLVPVIVATYIASAWTEMAEFGIQLSEQTKYVTYGTWISVAATLALQLALIPRFGAMGAAVAGLLSFWLRLGCIYYWSQKLHPIGYSWAPQVRMLLYGAGVVIAYFIVDPPKLIEQIGLASALFLLYCALCWTGGALPLAVRQRVVREIARRLHLVWAPHTVAPAGAPAVPAAHASTDE